VVVRFRRLVGFQFAITGEKQAQIPSDDSNDPADINFKKTNDVRL
jgi:hypothetical protein